MSLRCAAVVLAGGSGSRMGGNTPKQYLLLDGKPLIWYSLHAFEESPVEEVVLVVRPGETELCRRNLVEPFGFRKIRAVVEGGKERFHSVFAGLQALKGRGYDLVAIHDGARPMVSQEVIARTFQAAEEYGACVAAVPVKDTIKRADDDGFAAETLPRNLLWSVQTPQTFRFDLCLQAYETMMARPEFQVGITDDAMVVEQFTDTRVRLVMGDYKNLKVTTPEDLPAAERYLEQSGISAFREEPDGIFQRSPL